MRGRKQKPFWSYVKKTPTCWIWIGATSNRYGSYSWKGKATTSQRVSWQLANGPIPKGMYICHKCDNPPCVRPSHLFIGAAFDNNWDRVRKGRTKNPDRRGTKNGFAKHTEEQVLEIRKLYKRYSHKFNIYTLAKKYSVDPTSISLIVRRKQWTHI